ncbi:MAG TPA: molybdopterin-dependent oxidoreductase, partial [Xanthomonadales bacterium]|nr:molybdopterin-dependent oxidoreductase [Xanthomonadales bacterium]
DQGGECELQDLAMGYGRSVSRFAERKRVVPDEDLGPLVATDMTRCIQCTRCVRFSAEVAGTYELGGMFRGEHLEIGTYIGKSMESELSGNVIDVCPVGALTNKVFRFKARPWELVARPSIGWHDAIGSNLFLHERRGEVLRAVPRDNEAVNECWLSDRDRYSHEGLYAADRVRTPQLRAGVGEWREATWEEALAAAAEALRGVPAEQVGALVSPATSNEEGRLLAAIVRGLGSENIDHRLRVLDFADQPVAMPFERPLAEIERAGAIVLVGCNPRLEAPMLGHRVRQAWKHGAKIVAVNPVDFDFTFDVAHELVAEPWSLAGVLAGLVKAARDGAGGELDAELAETVGNADANDAMRAAVATLRQAGSGVVVFGEAGVQHPAASLLRALARALASAAGFAYDELPSGANAIGLAQNGVLPGAGGLNAAAMLARPRKAVILYGAEAPHDFADGNAADNALRQAGSVVAFTAYASDALRRQAHVILPIGLLPEVDATLVNVDGIEQVVKPGGRLPGDARPGWRVLRALGEKLGLPGFDFASIDELRARALPAAPASVGARSLNRREGSHEGLTRIGTLAPYRVDATLRRATALQESPVNRGAAIVLHPGDALAMGLSAGSKVRVSDGTVQIQLPVLASTAVPHGGAWIEAGYDETAMLAPTGAKLTVARV